MESGLNPEQTRAVQDFMMFLGERMSQTNYQFEHTMHFVPRRGESALYPRGTQSLNGQGDRARSPGHRHE